MYEHCGYRSPKLPRNATKHYSHELKASSENKDYCPIIATVNVEKSR